MPDDMVRIIVADDASGERACRGPCKRFQASIGVVAGESNVGFAANVNRGLAAVETRRATWCCLIPTWKRVRDG